MRTSHVALLVTLTLVVLALPIALHAASILPPCATSDAPGVAGDCDLTDFLQGFVNLAGYGLGILGVIGVLMFVIGGFYLLLSAGRSAMVAKGKSILAGATTGILIVLFAYVAIGFVYVSLTGDAQGTVFKGTPFAFSFLEKTKLKYTCTPLSAATPLTLNCSDKGGGGYIQRVQILLNSKAGCSTGVVTGVYTSDVAAAVANFQDSNGLTADGKVGPNTWAKLFDPKALCNTGVAGINNGGCCVPDPGTGGSCASLKSVSVPTTYGASCGEHFSFKPYNCDDVANIGTACAPFGSCTYMGPTGNAYIWCTGSAACNAVVSGATVDTSRPPCNQP